MKYAKSKFYVQFLLTGLVLLLVSACSDSGTTGALDDVSNPNMPIDIPMSVMGEFAPAPGSGKEAGGSATLRMIGDDRLSLDFSDAFFVSDGPGLYVILSDAPFPTDEAVNLGNFKSPMGAQMYDVPDGVDILTYKFVIIHCIPYNVTFATAELR